MIGHHENGDVLINSSRWDDNDVPPSHSSSELDCSLSIGIEPPTWRTVPYTGGGNASAVLSVRYHPDHEDWEEVN